MKLKGRKLIAVKFYYPSTLYYLILFPKYNFVKDVGFSNYFVTVRGVNQIRTTRLFWSEKQFCRIIFLLNVFSLVFFNKNFLEIFKGKGIVFSDSGEPTDGSTMLMLNCNSQPSNIYKKARSGDATLSYICFNV